MPKNVKKIEFYSEVGVGVRHFSSELRLADIALIGGFRMQGASFEDFAGFNFGRADINGDGLSDLIVCADGYDGGGLLAGGAFVIYGRAADVTANIDFAHLSPSDGFVIQGEFAYDLASRSIAGVGDLNGDGIADMLIGAFKNDENGHDSGAAYVIYGQTKQFPSVIDLYDLPADVGIKIVGEAAEDYAGFWVASAGDVNADGRPDIIMGSPNSNTGGQHAGAAYVIFGRETNFPGKIELNTLDPRTGFRISGAQAGDAAGFGVADAGDLNGDGISDLIVGAPQTGTSGSGTAYVIYGRAGIGDIHLDQLSATQGFVIHGEASGDMAGFNVAGTGDVNGDGIADFIVGATLNDSGGYDAGAAYVVFGRKGGFDGSLNLADLDGTNGFKIEGARAGDQNGVCVVGAGDVNGDGYKDVLVGAWYSAVDGTGMSAAHLLFGHAGGFAPVVDLDRLDPRDGIRIVSEATGDTTGRALTGAGDMNGDGYDDIAIGSPGNAAGGSQAGAAYVIYGRADNHAPTGASKRVAGIEDGEYQFTPDDFVFVDVDGDALADLTIETMVERGKLMLRGLHGASDTAVAVGQVITAADIRAGLFYYVGDQDASGQDYAHFNFRVRDDGGVVASGRDVAVTASTITIDLAADLTDAIDRVYGTAAADRLTGHGSQTELYGLAGDDVYIVIDQGQRAIEAAGEGLDTILTSVSYALDDNSEVERLLAADSTSTNPLLLQGNRFDNVIRGNAGANGLVGGEGANVLDGLTGDDTYVVSSAADRIIEARSDGYDTVYAKVDYTLTPGAYVEVLTAYDRAETMALNLRGNELDNLILGTNGSNILDGGGGRDTMYGYGGDDIFYVDSADDLPVELAGEGFDTIVTSVSYVMPQGMEFEILRTIDPTATIAINLTGNKIPNIIIGNAGANIIDGLGGGDDMRGLKGDDTYIIRRTNDRITELRDQGDDTASTLVDYTLLEGCYVETLRAHDPLSTTPLRLTGNALANTIIGNAGDNGLIGGGGADVLRGLGGDDTYIVETADTRVLERVGDGVDTVYTTVSYHLETGSEIEILTVYDRSTTIALRLDGNEFSNVIYGNAGNNSLIGGGGDDTLYGMAGDDSYIVDSAGDKVVEAAGNGYDTVYTTVSYALSSDTDVEVLSVYDRSTFDAIDLSGSATVNIIYGNNGANRIDGDLGNDILYGNGGADTFVFAAELRSDNVDTIVDFSSGADHLALARSVFTGIDAGVLSAGNLCVGAQAQDADDRIIYNPETGALSYDADGSGAGQAIQFAWLTPHMTLAASDIYLF